MDTTRLVIAAVIGLIVLLALIIRFKLPAMIAILVGAVLIGLGAGMSFEQIIGAVDDGIGNTLKGIALLVGLGSMFGSKSPPAIRDIYPELFDEADEEAEQTIQDSKSVANFINFANAFNRNFDNGDRKSESENNG